MFADAGYPVGPDGTLSDGLLDTLVISGSTTTIAGRLQELLASGLDELLVYPVTVQHAESELQQLMQVIGNL
jgi:alkanesulfonate monooxygenase SsuD/methylene tetrahydromethanopterin reductase-like flavin-dependent oxidoreductase (luciferase family)